MLITIYMAILRAFTWNARGLANPNSIHELRNYLGCNFIDLAFIQESMFAIFPEVFLARFPPSQFKMRHSASGQGIISIVRFRKFPKETKLELRDISADGTLAHEVLIDFPTGERLVFVNLYQPPSIDAISPSVLAAARAADWAVGDVNAYIGRCRFGRDFQVDAWTEFSGSVLCLDNTMVSSASDMCGPDFVIQNLDSEFPSWVSQVGGLQSDHLSLQLDIQVDTPLGDAAALSPPMHTVTKFKYSKISEDFKFAEYERLASTVSKSTSQMQRTSLDVFFSLWQTWLAKIRYKVREPINKSALVDKIAALTSQEEFDEFMSNWLVSANSLSNSGQTFRLINYLVDQSNSAAAAGLDQVHNLSKKTEQESWGDFKTTAETIMPLTASQQRQYAKTQRWIRKSLNFAQDVFTLSEFKSALKGINKKCVGLDKIPVSFFPTDDRHLQLLLDAVNGEIFCKRRRLKTNFLEALAKFIGKPNDPLKLRGLCIGNRLPATVERMIAGRLMEVVLKSKSLSDRFGFISGRNIDGVFAQLCNKTFEDKKSGRKSALVSFDQSKAYDTVDHRLLLIKLRKLVLKSGNLKRYAVLVFFTAKWLIGRSAKFGQLVALIKRGVPQGSPYSCLLYVVFFDFSAGNAEILSLYFADDNNYQLDDSTWSGLEDKILKLYERFDQWCSVNGQKINLTKSSIIFIRRKSPVPHSFPLKSTATNVTKMLGVYVDENFNFRHHAAYLLRWLSTRTTILRRLRVRLGVSVDVLLRVCLCYRAKICFGTWWTLAAADTTISALDSAFTRCIRASLGFSRLVPNQIVLDFSGVSGLLGYLPYWGASRSVVDYMRGNFDLVEEFLQSRMVAPASSSYSLRPSTSAKTLESRIRSNSKFSISATTRIEQMLKLRQFGLEQFLKCGLGFKTAMKAKFLPKILAKGTFSADAVKVINQKYYDKIVVQGSST